jgi:ABC-type bacteriocin/lantibiotic exporter with double-glycine peptidase domain
MSTYIKHKVPVIAQRRDMSCWYAAACMIGAYYEQGPRLGVPAIWIADEGIDDNEFQELATAESLVWFTAANHEFSIPSLVNALSKLGPMLSVCNMPQGKHAIVLVGAGDIEDKEDRVYYNDPAGGGASKTMPLKEFNERRYRGYMLIRDPESYPPGHRMKLERLR